MVEAWSGQEWSGRKRQAHVEGVEGNNGHRGLSDRKSVTQEKEKTSGLARSN